MQRVDVAATIVGLLLAAWLGWPQAPRAEEAWAMRPADSRLSFEASYDETPFEGRFEAFRVDLQFDPAAPQDAHLTAQIDIRSVNTDNRDRDEALAGSDWFDFARFPEATYEAHGFTPMSDGGFRSNGQLALKGVTADVPIEFDWRREGQGAVLTGVAVLSGDARVNRTVFGVGTGDWSDDELIGHWVEVRFKVVFEAAADP